MNSIHPTLKTYKDFLQNYEKEPESVKQQLYKSAVWARKEVERKKAQYQRRKLRQQEAILALPEDQRPKSKPVGRPRKKTVEDYKNDIEQIEITRKKKEEEYLKEIEELKKLLEEKEKLITTKEPEPVPEPEPKPKPKTSQQNLVQKPPYPPVINNTKIKKL